MRLRRPIPVGNGPGAVAVDARWVWVSNQFGGTLVRIDPRTNQVDVGQRSATGRREWRLPGGTVLVASASPARATVVAR